MDLHFAHLTAALLKPHVKGTPDPHSFRLFPDDRLDLPEDVEGQEQAWMLTLRRNEGK